MARLLLLHAQAEAGRTATSRGGAPASLVLVVFVVAAVATVVVSLCTSSRNARPGKQRGPEPRPREDAEESGGASGRSRQLLASISGIGSKAAAAAVAKMASWNRRSPPPAGRWSSDDDDDGEAVTPEEDALWKKTIIMGDRCRPLEFSGSIAYDSDGNMLPPPPPKLEMIKKAPGPPAPMLP